MTVREPIANIRHDLLSTAKQMLREQGLPERVDIRLADVVSAAGRTTGSAYPIWKSQREFQQDLAIFIADTYVRPDPTEFVELLADSVDRGLSSPAVVGAVAERIFTVYVAREDLRVVLPFFAVADLRTDIADTIRVAYEGVQASQVDIFGAVLPLLGRKPAYPGAVDDMSLALTAALEGMALRYRVSPELFTPPYRGGAFHPFSCALVGYLRFYTVPES